MWYTTKRFCVVFTESHVYALIYNRRHLLASQRFPANIAENPGPMLDWLREYAAAGLAGTLCVPHTACQSGRLALPGHQDRYQCYLRVKPQVGFDDWFDYHLYFDKQAQQTRVYWYALAKQDYHGLFNALEMAGFTVRGISTAPLMLRYASGQQLDKQGVTYLYHDGQTLHFCVYQNRLIASTLQQPAEMLDQNSMQIALQNLRQQVPLASNAQMIACTAKTQILCQQANARAAHLNTAWDASMAEALPEYVCLAGGLMAREWYEFSA